MNMTTGERMKRLRKEKAISVELIAEALGVSVATVYRYENGGIEKVPGSMLEPLSNILQTTPAYLMGWEDVSFPETSIGQISVENELNGLILRLKSSNIAFFEGTKMTAAEKSMLENNLQSAFDSIKIIVNSRLAD